MWTQKQKEKALERAAKAQTRYWNALANLECALGFDIDDPGELAGCTVEQLEAQNQEAEAEVNDRA